MTQLTKREMSAAGLAGRWTQSGFEMHRQCLGCGVEFFGVGRYCPDCRALAAELDPQLARYLDDAARPARRLRNVLWAAGAIGTLWYLIWCFRGFIVACFDMWFGGVN